MNRSVLLRSTALSAGALLALVTLGLPAGAGVKDSLGGSKPTETGCYDVIGGTDVDQDGGKLQRHIEYTQTTKTGTAETTGTDTGTVDVSGTPLDGTPLGQVDDVDDTPTTTTTTYEYTTYDRTFTDEVDATLVITLAAPSCPEVRYHWRVLDERMRVITDVYRPGDGVSNKVSLKTSFLYPKAGDTERAAYFTFTTENATGQVGDTAPDSGAASYEVGTGGGTVAWR